jgi:hypothetical protein
MKKRRDASASVSGSHSASQSTVASADKSSVELAGNGAGNTAGDPAGQSTNAATWRPRAGNRPLLIVAIICYATILAFLLSRSLAL